MTKKTGEETSLIPGLESIALSEQSVVRDRLEEIVANQYRRGANLERELVIRLRANGYMAARSASSKSPVDVWAVKDGQFRVFQCTLNGNSKKTSDRLKINKAYGVDMEIVTKESLENLEY